MRFTVVDPMHNLFLGTAKHVVEVWLEMLILSASDLERVQVKIDSSNVPSDLGRIPTKIAKMFSGFTAEQWKNFMGYGIFVVCIVSKSAKKGLRLLGAFCNRM